MMKLASQFRLSSGFQSLSEPQEHGVVGQPGLPQLTVARASFGARHLEPTALRGLAAERSNLLSRPLLQPIIEQAGRKHETEIGAGQR